MNFSIVIGWLLCWGLCVFGILRGGELVWFINGTALAVTLGGSVGATLACFPFSVLKDVPKTFVMAVFPKKRNPADYAAEMVNYTLVARSKGRLALEEYAVSSADPFVAQALHLIVDGNDPDKVRTMLEDSIAFMEARHAGGRAFYEKAVSLAPVFGMIGTLAGFVIMLYSLPEGLGAAMGAAVTSTLYGVLLAHVCFAPVESQLKHMSEREVLCMRIVTEGVLAVAQGDSLKIVKEKLELMLPRSSGISYGRR